MGYDYSPKGRKPRKGDDLKLIWLLILVGGGLTAAFVFLWQRGIEIAGLSRLVRQLWRPSRG